jgi:hypothetical protein
MQQAREQCQAPVQAGSKAANHPVGAIIDKKMQPIWPSSSWYLRAKKSTPPRWKNTP